MRAVQYAFAMRSSWHKRQGGQSVRVPNVRRASTLPVAAVFAASCVLGMAGCAAQAPSDTAQQEETTETSQDEVAETTDEAQAETGVSYSDMTFDEETLVATYPSSFEQKTYEDPDTGLTVTYNLFLPAGYDETASYPMVVFIADSSCTGDDATRSLTQGLGALVWASDEWQADHPCIVCVPTYPETILDDHSGYVTTDYVELTGRLVRSVASTYAVDASRIYGTGQSMGCMTTLILASEYPDLYAACMFVDGQWDVSTLTGLEGERFVYFAAEDDARAWEGMQEVMGAFDADGAPYAYAQWDGGWAGPELASAAGSLFGQGMSANFVSWATGTIDTSSGMGGGMPQGEAGGAQGEQGAPEGGPREGEGPGGEMGGMQGGGMGGAGAHMASFDYAYGCAAAMEWLFQQ